MSSMAVDFSSVFKSFEVAVQHWAAAELKMKRLCPTVLEYRQWKYEKLTNGEAGRRSQCLSHAKRALYHLSYIPRYVVIAQSVERWAIKRKVASSIHATAYLLFLHSTACYSPRGATSIFPLRFVCCVAWQLSTCSPSLPSLLSGVAPFENVVVLTPQVGSVFVV